jgi:hypothetical protein
MLAHKTANCDLFQNKLKEIRKMKQNAKENHKSELEIIKNKVT